MSDPHAPTPDQPPADRPEAAPGVHSHIPAAETFEERVIDALKTVFDPEIPVNIYDLGLIYGVEADEAARRVKITMTLTSPACPVAGSLPGEVETRVRELPDVDEAEVELVWDPPWDKDKLSEEAKLQLGLL